MKRDLDTPRKTPFFKTKRETILSRLEQPREGFMSHE
jgi:hypothetical protein